jgi:hypothetical protein
MMDAKAQGGLISSVGFSPIEKVARNLHLFDLLLQGRIS